MNTTEKNCIIIHGCPSRDERSLDSRQRTYDKHWIPWAKEQLDGMGIETVTPLMPEPWTPDYDAFRKEFEKYPVNEHTVLVGHSCGAAFLVRWLGDSKRKIRKLILVAPWKVPDKGDAGREAFYGYPVDETIKGRVQEIVIFTADNEEDGGKESAQIFHDAFGGTVIELNGHGHYTAEDMGTTEFPELIAEIK